MKRKICILLIATITVVSGLLAPHASAANYGSVNIISDSVMNNTGSMSASQIQSFLNGFTGACLGGGFQTPNPLGYSGGGYQYGGNVNAGTAIYTIANRYNLNPQVLISTLEKEQGLISRNGNCDYNNPASAPDGAECGDSNGNGPNYCSFACQNTPVGGCVAVATGYACPGYCRKSFNGFHKQISGAAWVLRFAEARAYGQLTGYSGYDSGDEYITYGGPMTAGYRQRVAGGPSVYYDGSYTDRDGNTMYIANGSTASMLNYTPFYARSYTSDKLFISSFTRWFGSPIGRNYAWSIESFSYAGGDNILAVNQPERVVLKARNTGNQPWYNHGNNPARLGTWNPADGPSSLIGNGIRFATVSESVVMPGSVGTFEFDITPSSKGTFVQAMNIVSENNEWASWPGFSPTIVVNSGYSGSIQNIVYGSGTGLMEPGSTQLITVIVKNTGSTTWSKTSGPKIRMATWPPGRSSAVASNWLSSIRATDMNENTVAPGENAGFQFYVKVPSSGNFYENMNLVAEGQEWFPNTNLTLYLEGKKYEWQPLWHSHSTGTANIPRNTPFTLTVKTKNTGTFTWYKNSGPKIRLATVAPQDRGSALYTPSWTRDTRPAELIEDSVSPGQEGTFVIQAKTPNVVGPRFERFSLVAEGYAWMNDPVFSIYVNVTP